MASIQELISLAGKTAIITGASQGIGEAIARRYHEAGANVVIADLKIEASSAIAESLNADRPGSALAVGVDVTDADQAAQLVQSVVEQFGGVDVLAANAGIFPFAPVADLGADQLRKVFDVNVVGVHNFLRPVAQHMVETGRQGKIVVTLSIDAMHPSGEGLGAYDASKHALLGYMRVAALEYAKHGIRINGFAPGGILTPGVTGGADTTELINNATAPVGRWGEADDMALVALFLGSDLNSYATGSVMVSDGGTLLK
ncbi:SDR family NAD(P)-dependent oxidoreductase [Agrococcus beijingensis]|uniref:SDR family NAD(P)-dependent oxidoreductase n=1 Tax=Agrococcus beijingensis TaxID=3068634 RepID=UPI002740B87A|nr:SDR family NAD(P)-dependent oxidoreductase [Agrococcus sp. REN33]